MFHFILPASVAFLAFIINIILKPRKLKIKGAHVLITGGSKGIGKALALEVARQGGNVTLLARNLDKLKETAEEVISEMVDPLKQKVHYIPCDVSGKFSDVQRVVEEAVKEQGDIDFLVNCAGISIAQPFEDIPVEEFQKVMDVNYMGSVSVTKAAIGGMKARGTGGRVVFVSSQAGQLGVFGYTAYSASKYALRGLAEALQMEVKPYNIYVTVSFPPDTDTPGFRDEMDDKPEECKQISATSGLFDAASVARTMLKDAEAGKYMSYHGLDGWMLANLTCGMSPASNVFQVITQGLLMGLLRVISLCYILSFDRIIKNCKQQREAKAKTQ